MISEARLVVSPRMLERLSAYRRLLSKWIADKRERCLLYTSPSPRDS